MRTLSFALALAISQQSSAAPFTVKDIQVEGLQRIAPSSIFSYLPVKPQQQFDIQNPQQTQNLIDSLYRTNLFSNIKLSAKDNVLYISVKEYPVIGEINISGNSDIKTSDIKEALANSNFSEGQSFNPATLKDLVYELDQQYQLRNKYGVKIEAETRDLERGRVAVDVNIKEGRTARIQNINFTGNKVYDDKTLSELLDTTNPRWNSWFTKSDQYNPEKLDKDLQRLSDFYLNRGFIDFRINSSQINVDKHKEALTLDINIYEGQAYKVRSYQIVGDLVVPYDDLNNLIAFKKDEFFNKSLVERSVNNMRTRLADEGYALAQVEVIPKIDRLTQQVDLQFAVVPNKKVYVRKIEFSGNEKTYDIVLRRELRQEEGSLYSSSETARSLERLRRLPQLIEVEEIIRPVNDTQIDIEYKITERKTNSIKGGVGYGQSSGALFTLEYNDENFFGTGYNLGVNFGKSSAENSYGISLRDPYFTESGISATYRFNYSKQNYQKSDISDWNADNWETSVSFGYPLSEYQNIYLGGGLRGIKINLGKSPAEEIKTHIEKNGSTHLEPYLNIAWSRDSLNHQFIPSKGFYNYIGGDVVFNKNPYFKGKYEHHSFYGLGEENNENLIFALHGKVNYGHGFKDKDMPFYRHFYVGGINSVRGFEYGTLGPRYADGSVAGGDFAVEGSAEVILPWRLSQRSNNLRLGAFVDFGSAYRNLSEFKAKDFRYSAGMFLQWISPIGPLSISYAKPLNAKPGDKVENFQFSVGATF